MTNNKQQTAVDWFLDQLLKDGYIKRLPVLQFQQAKEMEKKQHWATWGNGVANAENEKLFQDHWNETYGGNK
jgi:hypothetical protein